MNLRSQKRVAAAVLGCGVNRVYFAPDRLADIKEAITKEDMRQLVEDGAIKAAPKSGVSRARARKLILQRRKHTSRLSRKREWILRVRVQRRFLKSLKEKALVSGESYKMLRSRVKGGFFRSRRHIQLFVQERGLLVKKDGKK